MLALASGLSHSQQEQPEWLEYDAADIQVIDNGIGFGMGPELVLATDSLEKAQIVYGDPTLILYEDGSSLLLRSEEHTSELQSRPHLVCRLLLEKKKK